MQKNQTSLSGCCIPKPGTLQFSTMLQAAPSPEFCRTRISPCKNPSPCPDYIYCNKAAQLICQAFHSSHYAGKQFPEPYGQSAKVCIRWHTGPFLWNPNRYRRIPYRFCNPVAEYNRPSVPILSSGLPRPDISIFFHFSPSITYRTEKCIIIPFVGSVCLYFLIYFRHS